MRSITKAFSIGLVAGAVAAAVTFFGFERDSSSVAHAEVTEPVALPEPSAQAKVCAAAPDLCLGGFVQWKTGRITRITKNCPRPVCEARDDTPVSQARSWATRLDPSVVQIVLKQDRAHWEAARDMYLER